MNRRARLVILMTIIAVTLIPLAVQGHILKLKDGRILTGDFVSATKHVVKFKVPDEPVMEIPISDIISIHFSSATVSAPPQQKSAEPIKILPGTVIRVRMTTNLGTAANSAGEKFFATLAEDLTVDGVVLSTKGKRVFGRVRKVVKPKRSIDKALIEIVLTDLTIGGRLQPVITDHFGVRNDGQGTVSFLGPASAPEAPIPTLMDGRNVTIPTNTLLEFRVTQPVTIRDFAP